MVKPGQRVDFKKHLLEENAFSYMRYYKEISDVPLISFANLSLILVMRI